MVNSQALRLVPSRNELRWFHALNRVSCTRSSARSRSPQSDTANARRLVISPTRDSRRLSDTFRAQIICLRFARGLSKAGADDRGLALAQLRRTRHADGGRYGLANWATNPLPWRAMRPAAFRLLESWFSRRSFASAGVPFSLPGPQSSPIRRGSLPKRRIRSIPCVQKRAQPQVVPGSRETFLAPTAFKHTVTRVSIANIEPCGAIGYHEA